MAEEGKRNLLLTLRFIGTNYHGWQYQENALSVQEVLIRAGEGVLGGPARLHGCSRTDSGVHALTYCANFHTDHPIPCRKLILALNAHLPPDIAVTDCREVPEEFHARYSTREKEYRYRILNSSIRDPFLEGFCYRYPHRLDEQSLEQTFSCLLGTHDFRGFSSVGWEVTDTVRTLTGLRIERRGDVVDIFLKGDGFLYNMVRIIVGTMLRVSEGKLSAQDLLTLLETGDRSLAGPTAPAQGLALYQVYYPEEALKR